MTNQHHLPLQGSRPPLILVEEHIWDQRTESLLEDLDGRCVSREPKVVYRKLEIYRSLMIVISQSFWSIDLLDPHSLWDFVATDQMILVLYDSVVSFPMTLANVFFPPIHVSFFFPFFQTKPHVHPMCYTAGCLYCAIHFWALIFSVASIAILLRGQVIMLASHLFLVYMTKETV